MNDFYYGAIIIFGGNFAPEGFAICQGQVLPISDNQPFYAVIGNIYGGDGRTSFALPDFRGRMCLGFGTDQITRTDWEIGQKSGNEEVTLTTEELPLHSHNATLSLGSGSVAPATVQCFATDPSGSTPIFGNPAGRYWGPVGGGNTIDAYYDNATGTMAADAVEVNVGKLSATAAIQPIGNQEPVSIMQPIQVINFIICTNGIFPPRN